MTKDIEDRKELMKQIRDEVVALKNSPLYKFRIENKNLPVIGEGSHSAKIMFIGEAPGRNEAKTGRPFCGRAGEIFNKLLESVEIKREDVYVTNIVKDRPPQNRDPLQKKKKIREVFRAFSNLFSCGSSKKPKPRFAKNVAKQLPQENF